MRKASAGSASTAPRMGIKRLPYAHISASSQSHLRLMPVISLKAYCKCSDLRRDCRAVVSRRSSSWYLLFKWLRNSAPTSIQEYTYHSHGTMSRLPHYIPENPEGSNPPEGGARKARWRSEPVKCPEASHAVSVGRPGKSLISNYMQ